jgi:hypothetical protein
MPLAMDMIWQALTIIYLAVQGDMRDCLNVPGSLPRSSGGTSTNGMFDLEPPQTALGECMDVIDLPVQMARDQIEQSLRAKMASIKECMMQLQGSQKGLQSTESWESNKGGSIHHLRQLNKMTDKPKL